MYFLSLLCLIVIVSVQSFTMTRSSKDSKLMKSQIRMAEELDPDAGYGPVGTLLRQGPVPFVIRISQPDTYEAAVNKYMALEKCSRLVAQANMDAYFQDPNGWAANKLKARKTGKDIDYTRANVDSKSLVLTAIWATGISYLFYRIFAVQVLHQS